MADPEGLSMNHATDAYIGEVIARYPMRGRILEIGSRDICGSARHWFTAGPEGERYEHWHPTERFPEYIGIDLIAGNAVDLVMDSHRLDFPDEHFDVVLSTSQMEHDSDPFQTMREVVRVMKHGAYFIFTAPSWRGEIPHDVHDYWRFMVEGVKELFHRAPLELLEIVESEPTNDIMAVGRKV